MAEMSEEQMKALQEKIKNMSPEELKEFQKQQCIFCQIIGGKVASRKIYDDSKCLAILDINPANPGHILLMPKEHYAIMPMIPEDEMGHLAMVAKALSHVMLNSLKAEGTNILIANGIAAGQRAQHFMMHVIPRKEGDELPFDIPEKKMSAQALASIKKKLQEKVEKIFEQKKKVIELDAKPEVIKISDEKKETSEEPKHTKKEAEKKEIKKKADKESKKETKEKESKVGLDDIASLFK